MGLFGDQSLTLGRKTLFPVKLSQKDRTHIYVIGGSRTGKSSELYNLILQDIKAGRGVGVLDVHSELTQELEKAIYHLIPEEEKKDRVVILDPTRGFFGFNPLEVPEGEKPYPYILELQSVFKKLWEDFWGPRMADLFRNTCLVMTEKNLTMCQMQKFIMNPAYRRYLVKTVKNPQVKSYWEDRFERWSPREKNAWPEPALNKVNKFVGDPRIRNVVCQRKSTIDFRKIMDNPKGAILLITIPKGLIKDNVYLLGALLICKIQEAALSRVDIPESQRRKFHLYIDEFQNFGTESSNFEEILSESGKYGLSLTLAHQDLGQIDEKKLLKNILGNTDCQISFRVQREDAETLAKEIFQIDVEDLEWRRNQGKSYHTLSEEWEKKFNALTSLKKREAYVGIKERGSYFIRSIDKETYQTSPQQLQAQAEQIMAPYTKSEEEIKKEQEQLNEELKPKGPKFKG